MYRNPYPRWDPQYNPVPFMEPGWNLGQRALGVTGWAEITLELIRGLTAPSAPSHVTDHFVMRGSPPALRFMNSLALEVIHKITGAKPASVERTYVRWCNRTRDYGLERTDLYDMDHPRSEGWFALDLRGAYDALWAILGVPHPLETELPPYGQRGLGESREFELLEEGQDRLNASYPDSVPPRRAREAFERQLERHGRFYSSERSEDEDLLPEEHPLEEGQYVRHYSIYPETLKRISTAEAARAAAERERAKLAAERAAERTVCGGCGGPRLGHGFKHTASCRTRPVQGKLSGHGKSLGLPRSTPQAREPKPPSPPMRSCPGCGGRASGRGCVHADDCSVLEEVKARVAARDSAKVAAKKSQRKCPGCGGAAIGRGYRHAHDCSAIKARDTLAYERGYELQGLDGPPL